MTQTEGRHASIPDVQVISAEHVICRAGCVLSPGWVRVENERVAEVGEGDPPSDTPVVIGGSGSILFPGLVSAHTHLALGRLRHVADDKAFLDWILQGVLPAIEEGSRDPEFFKEGAALSALELQRGGVTLVGDNFLRTEGARAMELAGLGGIFFQEVFGSLAPSDAEYLGELETELNTLSQRVGSVPFGYSPHTPWTCPAAVVQWVTKRARQEGRRISLHLDESREEHAFFVDETGPLHEIAARRGNLSRYRFGLTPTAYLADLGVLGPDVIAAHCVQVTDEDVELLAASGTSVAHCPVSNMKLAEGIAPVLAMLEAGVNVCLGVDSAASTGKLDLFDEMRAFVLAQRGRYGRIGALTARTALDMATLAGARALGLEGETGSLEAGKRADMVLMRADRPRHGPLRDPEATVVHTGTPDDVVLVVHRGRVLHLREDSR